MIDQRGYKQKFRSALYFIQSCNSIITAPILLVCVLVVVVTLSPELTFLTILWFVGWFSVVAIRVGISSLLVVVGNGESS